MNLKYVSCLPNDYYVSPDFYKELLEKWILFKNIHNKHSKNFFDILKEVIWGNKIIQCNKKALFFTIG